MYAPLPVESKVPSGPKNSIRVEATREPKRSTCACKSKYAPIPGGIGELHNEQITLSLIQRPSG